MSPWQGPAFRSQILPDVLQLSRNRAISGRSNSLWCALHDGMTVLKLLFTPLRDLMVAGNCAGGPACIGDTKCRLVP